MLNYSRTCQINIQLQKSIIFKLVWFSPPTTKVQKPTDWQKSKCMETHIVGIFYCRDFQLGNLNPKAKCLRLQRHLSGGAKLFWVIEMEEKKINNEIRNCWIICFHIKVFLTLTSYWKVTLLESPLVSIARSELKLLKNWEKILEHSNQSWNLFQWHTGISLGWAYQKSNDFFFFKWYLNTLSQLADLSRVKEHLPQGYYSSQEDFPLTLEWYKQVQLSLHTQHTLP